MIGLLAVPRHDAAVAPPGLILRPIGDRLMTAQHRSRRLRRNDRVGRRIHAARETAMNILDSILGQVSGNATIDNLAAKVGLSPEHVDSAVQALAKHHQMAGDTAEGAAAATGLPLDKMQELITQIGGEGALGKFATMLQTDGAGGILGALDRDGDGNPLNDLADMAGGLFGKK
jgi:hypothetical protein